MKAYVIKDGKKKYVSKSPLVHAYTSGGNKTYTNAKSIKIDTSDGRIKKNKLTLKVKDTYKVKAGVGPDRYLKASRILFLSRFCASINL